MYLPSTVSVTAANWLPQAALVLTATSCGEHGGADSPLDGAPDLTIEGLETVTYLDDLIVQLEEELTPDSQQAMKTWIGAHGKALGIGS